MGFSSQNCRSFFFIVSTQPLGMQNRYIIEKYPKNLKVFLPFFSFFPQDASSQGEREKTPPVLHHSRRADEKSNVNPMFFLYATGGYKLCSHYSRKEITVVGEKSPIAFYGDKTQLQNCCISSKYTSRENMASVAPMEAAAKQQHSSNPTFSS